MEIFTQNYAITKDFTVFGQEKISRNQLSMNQVQLIEAHFRLYVTLKPLSKYEEPRTFHNEFHRKLHILVNSKKTSRFTFLNIRIIPKVFQEEFANFEQIVPRSSPLLYTKIEVVEHRVLCIHRVCRKFCIDHQNSISPLPLFQVNKQIVIRVERFYQTKRRVRYNVQFC